MATILAEPDAAKAVTAPGGSMMHVSFPILKWRDTDTVNPVDGTPDLEIIGSATDGTLDSDLQIVDPVASARWIKSWFDTKANVRLGHDPKRPVGKGLHVDGHRVLSIVREPVAKHLVRTGVLNDYSVGIMNPGIAPVGDPRFRHLDPAGKAVNGYITDHPDGTTELGEISIVDRGSNYGTAFQIAKAAGNGSFELTGTMTAPPAVLAKVAAPKVYKSVSVDMPAGMRIRFSPAQLAKMNTMAAQNAVAAAGVTKVAEPAVPTMVTEDGFTVPDTSAMWEASALAALKAAEAGIYKRDIDTATRRRLASEGKALPNLSYPIETAGDLGNAATLARSGHGDVAAATALIGRRAKELGVANPMKKPKKGKKSKAAAPDVPVATEPVVKVAACDACKDTGAVDGQPCAACDEGVKAAKAMAALDNAVAGLDAVISKKRKVMCTGCGAKQSVKHAMCSECGRPLSGAMPVTKNHDYNCLGCGREDLDKGERHCPQCGKENPGYLPEADHKIPANKAAGKDRVSDDTVTKAGKGKKAGMKPKKGKKGNPFGGNQAKPFGKTDDDADDKKDTAKAGAPAVAKRKGKKKGGKGRSPAVGDVAQSTTGLPPHREPDGPPVEAFEQDLGASDGDMEMKAAMRVKALGIDPADAALHDLTCPAFHPATVAKAVPWAEFTGIDTEAWQAKALQAVSSGGAGDAMARWNEAAALSRHAVTLKTADPQVLWDLRLEHHAAFRDANKALTGATPGPGSFPTPGHPMPGQFKRPYIAAGHAAPSPMHDGPHSFPVPDNHPVATDFSRDYLTAGHAMDSPANDTPRHEPQPAPAEAGKPSRVFYANHQRDSYRQALTSMHDHLSRIYPGVCAMSPDLDDIQKPAPPVPDAVGGPLPHAAPAMAGKAAKAAAKAAAAKKAARTTARKAAAMRRKVERQVLKGTLSVEDARAKLGLKPFAVPETIAKVAVPATPETLGDAAVIAEAVRVATAPLAKQLKAQDKALRKNAKVLDAIANQPDTTSAPFRGAGVAKTTMTMAPAGPVTAAESAEQAQVAKMRRLHHEWRTTPNPEHQEAAWQELNKMLGIAPLTGDDESMIPLRRPMMT